MAKWAVRDEASLATIFRHWGILPDPVKHLSVLLWKEACAASQELVDDVLLLLL